MPTTCPHCGETLRDVGDAFCSECREELPPPAGQPNLPGKGQLVQDQSEVWSVLSVALSVLPLLCGMIAAVVVALPAGVVQAGTLVVALASGALAIGAYFRARRMTISGREKRYRKSESPQ